MKRHVFGVRTEPGAQVSSAVFPLQSHIKAEVAFVARRGRNVRASRRSVRMDTDGLNPPTAEVCNTHDRQSHVHMTHVHAHHKHTAVTIRTWVNTVTAARARRARRPVFEAKMSP